MKKVRERVPPPKKCGNAVPKHFCHAKPLNPTNFLVVLAAAKERAKNIIGTRR